MSTNAVRVARGGPKYRMVPVVLAVLVLASFPAGWLLFLLVGA